MDPEYFGNGPCEELKDVALHLPYNVRDDGELQALKDVEPLATISAIWTQHQKHVRSFRLRCMLTVREFLQRSLARLVWSLAWVIA